MKRLLNRGGLQTQRLDFWARGRAALMHLAICIAVAVLVAPLVFLLWYPGPYRLISNGESLFTLVVSVDLALGPLLTFAVYDVGKGWRHLRCDLAVIAVLQLAGLGYGLHVVYMARPVATVFETDRFRVIAAADVYLPELLQAPVGLQRLPLGGPWLLGTRSPRTGEERNDALFMGLQGIDVGQRPKFWQPYDMSRAAVLMRSRPVKLLMAHDATKKGLVDAALIDAGLKADEVRFLPLVARGDWVVLLNAKGDIAGYVPVDGFF